MDRWAIDSRQHFGTFKLIGNHPGNPGTTHLLDYVDHFFFRRTKSLQKESLVNSLFRAYSQNSTTFPVSQVRGWSRSLVPAMGDGRKICSVAAVCRILASTLKVLWHTNLDFPSAQDPRISGEDPGKLGDDSLYFSTDSKQTSCR